MWCALGETEAGVDDQLLEAHSAGVSGVKSTEDAQVARAGIAALGL